jgi:hypothetical protein
VDEVAASAVDGVHDDGLQDAALADVFGEFGEFGVGYSVRGLCVSSSSSWIATCITQTGRCSTPEAGGAISTEANDGLHGPGWASAAEGDAFGSGSNPVSSSWTLFDLCHGIRIATS